MSPDLKILAANFCNCFWISLVLFELVTNFWRISSQEIRYRHAFFAGRLDDFD